MKWGYKILDIATAQFIDTKGLGVKFDVEAATKHLNELGRDGWELVATTNMTAPVAFTSLVAVMIFKRPLPEQ